MNNVIKFASFKSRKVEVDLYETKLARFCELKPKNFSDTFEGNEEIEFENLYNWLQIHKKNEKQSRMAN